MQRAWRLTVVVANRGCMHADVVQHGHHLLAAREGRHEGGVEAVAAEQHQRLLSRILPDGVGKARGAAHGLYAALLNVVYLRRQQVGGGEQGHAGAQKRMVHAAQAWGHANSRAEEEQGHGDARH
jgi:hypothetical protein